LTFGFSAKRAMQFPKPLAFVVPFPFFSESLPLTGQTTAGGVRVTPVGFSAMMSTETTHASLVEQLVTFGDVCQRCPSLFFCRRSLPATSSSPAPEVPFSDHLPPWTDNSQSHAVAPDILPASLRLLLPLFSLSWPTLFVPFFLSLFFLNLTPSTVCSAKPKKTFPFPFDGSRKSGGRLPGLPRDPLLHLAFARIVRALRVSGQQVCSSDCRSLSLPLPLLGITASRPALFPPSSPSLFRPKLAREWNGRELRVAVMLIFWNGISQPANPLPV